MDSVFRALAIYLVLLVVTRFSGRRTMGELTLFEFVLLLIIAETTQQALLGEVSVQTNLLLDVGVYLLIVGVVVDLLRSLGAGIERDLREAG